MAVALALVSALCYGVSDYVGGRASRRRSPLAITFSAELVIAAIVIVVVPLVESGWPDDPRVWWGAVGGLGGAFGVLGLYRALSTGSMTVVAPITGLVAATVPVVAGLALGERPGLVTAAGIALAVAAVGLIGGIVGALHEPLAAGMVGLSVLVGATFGSMFVAFSEAGDTGLWPLLTARTVSVPVLAVVYAVGRRRDRIDAIDRAAAVPALAIGALVACANGFYLLSTREGLLVVVAVVVSFYPASTIMLAMLLDHERATRWQFLGMAIASIAVVLITIS